LILIGGLLAIIGCVLYHWYPYAGLVVGIVGGFLLTVGLILLLIWWVVCRLITACSVILAAIDFVTTMIFVFAIITAIVAIIAIVVKIPSMWGCVGQAGLSWAGWGVILALLVWLARDRGCLVANPSGAPPPSSSSNPLSSSGPTRLERPPRPSLMAANPPAGLGDAMKGAFARMGVQPCTGCEERARALNRRFPLGEAAGPPGPAGLSR